MPHPPLFKWHSENIPIEKITNQNILNVDCESLKQDILKNGLKESLWVVPNGDGTYKLVEGVHRIKALRELGWKKIPCMVFDEY
jgi:ParB-like chromosome segregation protein Spo0J